MLKPYFLLIVPVAFGLARPAHAQSVLFSEQFDTPSRWSTPVRKAADVKQYKGSDWLQYPPLGNIAPSSFNLGYTEWGNKPVQMSGDGSEGRFLRFKLGTYNPNNFKANRASKFCWGTELQTLRKFGPPSVGHAIEFESRLRLPVSAPRMTSSFYTYSQKQSRGTVFSDEVDFEYIGADFGNEVLLTSWNEWARRNDSGAVPSQNYNDGKHHQSALTGTASALTNGVDRTKWHLLKIRWSCLSSGQYRIQYFSKQSATDAYKLLCTQDGAAPNDAMEVHLNIWATDPDPKPTSAPGTDYIMDVDWCRVSDVLLAAIVKSSPKFSGAKS
jgi:hypothetical protein